MWRQHITQPAQQIIERHPLLILSALTLAGAALRFYHLGFKSLWLDEAVIYGIAGQPLAGIVQANAANNSAPPLYALLIHAVLLLGDSESVLRSLSFMAGVAAIPATYFLTSRFERPPAALFAALLVTVAPAQIQYSQQLREYSLAYCLACLVLAGAIGFVRQADWRSWLLVSLASATGILLQYGLALLVAAVNLAYLMIWVRQPARRWSNALTWLAAQIPALLAVGIVFVAALRRQMHLSFGASPISNYLAGAYWDGTFDGLLRLIVFNSYQLLQFAFPAGLLFLFLVLVGIAVAATSANGRIALVYLLTPALLTIFAAAFNLYPYHGDRQTIFLTPMIYVMAALGFAAIRAAPQRAAAVLLVAILTLVGLGQSFEYLARPGPEHMRPAAEVLRANLKAGDQVYAYYSAAYAARYYLRDEKVEIITGIGSRSNPQAYLDQLDEVLANGNRLWMVFSHCYLDECRLIIDHAMQQRQVEKVASDVDVEVWLAYPPDR